jgi:hypothetical protein
MKPKTHYTAKAYTLIQRLADLPAGTVFNWNAAQRRYTPAGQPSQTHAYKSNIMLDQAFFSANPA